MKEWDSVEFGGSWLVDAFSYKRCSELGLAIDRPAARSPPPRGEGTDWGGLMIGCSTGLGGLALRGLRCRLTGQRVPRTYPLRCRPDMNSDDQPASIQPPLPRGEGWGEGMCFDRFRWGVDSRCFELEALIGAWRGE